MIFKIIKTTRDKIFQEDSAKILYQVYFTVKEESKGHQAI